MLMLIKNKWNIIVKSIFFVLMLCIYDVNDRSQPR